MNSKRWAALIIAGALFLVSIAYQIATSGAGEEYTNILEDDLFDEKIVEQGNWEDRIAVLDLQGIIQDTGEVPFMDSLAYDHRQFLQMIDTAAEDPTIDGIIINVNSPGGGVVESAEIRDKIIEAQEESDKPVYVSMGNTAASGGYYISAPADKIFAQPATLTGSIGVIMESINYTELAEELGVDFDTIKSGEFKDIMSASRPMTDEDEEILQTMVDEMYDEFVDVIVDGRDLSEEEVRDLADGRVYTGKQAKELELVDELGSLDDTITVMEDDLDLGDAQIVEYEASYGFGQLFGMTAQNLFGSDNELKGVISLIRDTSGPRAMYLYSN